MKLTKQRIKQLIKEELRKVLEKIESKRPPGRDTEPKGSRDHGWCVVEECIQSTESYRGHRGALKWCGGHHYPGRACADQLREQQEVSPCGKKPLWPGDAKASRKVDPSGDVLKDQRAWYKCKNKGTKLPAGYPFSPKNSDVAAAGQTGPADILAPHPKPPKSTSPSAPSKTPREQPFRRAALSAVKDPIGKLESQLGDINAALQALLKIGKIDAETVNKIKAALDGASALMLKAKKKRPIGEPKRVRFNINM